LCRTSARRPRSPALLHPGALVELGGVHLRREVDDFAKAMGQKAGRKFTRKIDREALGLSVTESST